MTQSNGAMDISQLEPRPVPSILWVSIVPIRWGFGVKCTCGWKMGRNYLFEVQEDRRNHINLHWQRGEEVRNDPE